jgi:hypothetical protein
MAAPDKATKAIQALNEVAQQISENSETVVGFVVGLVYQADDQIVVDCRTGGPGACLIAIASAVDFAAMKGRSGEIEAEFDGELDDPDGEPCECEHCRPRAH